MVSAPICELREFATYNAKLSTAEDAAALVPDQSKLLLLASLDGVVTDTRMDTQYVVTEHGVVNLLGKSTSERALALIEIAHPEFRQNLLEQAIRMGIVP